MAFSPEPIPVFIIALKSRTRCIPLCNHLTQLGISFEIVDAIDGSALDQAELDAVYDEPSAIRRVGRPMGRGEIGCALSHRKVYQMMAARGIALALILEEDAVLGSQFAPLWQAASSLPADVDALLLYSENGFVRRQPSTTIAGCGVHQATVMLSNTVGYFIRAACADALLRSSLRIEMVADWPLDHREMRQFLAIPMPVGHDRASSTITAERPAKNLLGKFQVPRWLSAVIHLTYIGYLLEPGRYQGPASYFRREVAVRLKRLVAPAEIDVGTLRAPQPLNEPV